VTIAQQLSAIDLQDLRTMLEHERRRGRSLGELYAEAETLTVEDGPLSPFDHSRSIRHQRLAERVERRFQRRRARVVAGASRV
jgi:hypothetical protein